MLNLLSEMLLEYPHIFINNHGGEYYVWVENSIGDKFARGVGYTLADAVRDTHNIFKKGKEEACSSST